MSGTLELRLSRTVIERFRCVVSAVLRLSSELDVLEYLGSDPWGDLEAFRREVYDPMRTGDPAQGRQPVGAVSVGISTSDLARMNGVLEDLYESYSGGRPWLAITPEERTMFERLAVQLGIKDL